MKICPRCHIAKPPSDFHANKVCKDGRNTYCKACAIAKAKAWREAHLEQSRLACQRNYAARKDDYKRRAKQWAADNRERRREIVRAYDSRNIETKRKRGRETNKVKYYADLEASRARMRRDAKRFRERRPEVVRKYAKQSKGLRRARKLAVPSERINFKLIMERDGMRCHICKKPVLPSELHFDHIIPLARGGPHTNVNIAVSHGSCNQSKGAKILTLF